jgi:hypothetical protein
MGTPAHLSLNVYRGDDYTWTTTFTNTTTGLPIVITGWTITGSIRSALGGKVIATFGVLITDGPGGVVELSLTAAQTRVLPNNAIFDIQAVDAGMARTYLAGPITATGDVT